MNTHIFNSSLVDMMKRFPLINSESEAESVARCPKSIYQPHPSVSEDFLKFLDLRSAMLGEFCIIASKDDKMSEGDKWKISNIELKGCEHELPR